MNRDSTKSGERIFVSPVGSGRFPVLGRRHFRVASLIPIRDVSASGWDWTEGNEVRLGILTRCLVKMMGQGVSMVVCPAGYFQFDAVKPEDAARSVAVSVSEVLAAIAPETTVVAGLDVACGTLSAQSVIVINKDGLVTQVFKLFPTSGETTWGTTWFEAIDLSLATQTLADRSVVISGQKVVLAVCNDVYGMHHQAMSAGRNAMLARAATRCEVAIDVLDVAKSLQSGDAWRGVNPGLVVNCVHDFDGGAGRFTTEWGKLCDATQVPLLAAAFYTNVKDPNLRFCRRPDDEARSGGSPVDLAADFSWFADNLSGGDRVWVQCFDLPT